MIYQMLIKALNDLKSNGTDIGNAIRYCSDNIFDLVHMHENCNIPVQDLIGICLDNK